MPAHKVSFQLRTLQDDGTTEVIFTVEGELVSNEDESLDLLDFEAAELGARAKRIHAEFIAGWANQEVS